jgi:hypothetical protein
MLTELLAIAPFELSLQIHDLGGEVANLAIGLPLTPLMDLA